MKFTTISSYWIVHASAQLLFQDGFYCRRQSSVTTVSRWGG